jgi:hypothetical protein
VLVVPDVVVVEVPVLLVPDVVVVPPLVVLPEVPEVVGADTVIVLLVLLLPPLPVTVSVTVYVPGFEYVSRTVVLVAVLLSPRFQERLVMLPVDASANVTVSGAVPLVGLAVKLATGAAAGTLPVTSLE